MTAIEPLFDMQPEQAEPSDHQTWCEEVRPAFVEAALSGWIGVRRHMDDVA